MVHAFQSTFQAAHDKWDLGFKGPKSVALQEHFANLDVHDQNFDIDSIGLYFNPSSPTRSNCSIPYDLFDPPSSNIIFFYQHGLDP